MCFQILRGLLGALSEITGVLKINYIRFLMLVLVKILCNPVEAILLKTYLYISHISLNLLSRDKTSKVGVKTKRLKAG